MSVLKGLLFLKEVLNALHRDIKPANLLLGANGEIKIGDFGLAKVLIEGNNKNTNVGTEAYLPPERLNNEKGDEYSSESDVWAYGLSMVELGLLQFPYNHRNPFDKINAIVKGPPPALPADRYSPELCGFFAKCLIKEQVRQLRPLFWITSRAFLCSMPPHKRRVMCSKSCHACRVPIGACDPMLCPIHVFRAAAPGSTSPRPTTRPSARSTTPRTTSNNVRQLRHCS